MRQIELKALAKINLGLDVLGRRENGYHDVRMVMQSIYLYDDYFTLIINASRKPLSIENIPLNDIEAAFSGDTYTSAKCSSMKPSAPPY